MATRRGNSTTNEIVVDGREELGEEVSASVNAKRPRVGFPPTVTETTRMRDLWKELRADGLPYRRC